MKFLLLFLFFVAFKGLQAQNIDLSTTTFIATVIDEKNLQFSFNLKNAGTSATQGYTLSLVFSKDNVLDFNDQFTITVSDPNQSIGAGTTIPKSGQYTASAPGGYMPSGAWYVFAEINFDRGTTETNYANNITLGNKITINNYVINFTMPPTITTITNNSFVINTYQEPDITKIYYRVQLNGATAPSETIMKTADPIYPWIDKTDVTNLGPAVDYDVYFMGEFYDGKVTSVLKIDVKTSGSTQPTLITSETKLEFEAINKNVESSSLPYILKGFYLTSNVTVAASGNFLISKNNIAYSNEIFFSPSDFSQGQGKTVYVKFLPGGETGIHTGEIIHTAANAQQVTLGVSAIAFDPTSGNFDGLTNLDETGWSGISVSGHQAWELIDRDNAAGGRTSSDDKVLRMDGSLNGNTINEDWLISPKMDLSTYSYAPMLSFQSYTSGLGASLQLKYSTNYIGEGNPTDASWTDFQGKFPAENSAIWTTSSDIELPKTNNIYFAFVYKSTDTKASRWLIDNWTVSDRLLNIPAFNLSFPNVMVGSASEAKSFTVQIVGYGDVTVSVSTGFQVSLDNTTFGSSVVLTTAQASAGQTVYVRFAPSSVAENLSGTVSFSANGLTISRSTLVGSTSITTAINRPSEASRLVYPNPTRGTVYVNSSELTQNPQPASVRVFSGLGLAVTEFQASIAELDGNLSSAIEAVQPGLYLIVIQSGDVIVYEKIIKE